MSSVKTTGAQPSRHLARGPFDRLTVRLCSPSLTPRLRSLRLRSGTVSNVELSVSQCQVEGRESRRDSAERNRNAVIPQFRESRVRGHAAFLRRRSQQIAEGLQSRPTGRALGQRFPAKGTRNFEVGKIQGRAAGQSVARRIGLCCFFLKSK
jgi:hypothetical protein